MDEELPLGTSRVIDGVRRVYYYGYWIKEHEVPADTLLAKKRLIEAHTRRLFNHVEHGLNIAGARLPEARAAYDAETDPERKRIKAGMLAGALFNRAADIFTKLVEIQSLGVEIRSDNAIMRECGERLQEALTLGKKVLHRSGEEGIDELWGEPSKRSRSQSETSTEPATSRSRRPCAPSTLSPSDLHLTFSTLPSFAGVEPLITELAHTAKAKTETLRTDADVFDVWPSFVVCTERLAAFETPGFVSSRRTRSEPRRTRYAAPPRGEGSRVLYRACEGSDAEDGAGAGGTVRGV